jgi:hypothetical protein
MACFDYLTSASPPRPAKEFVGALAHDQERERGERPGVVYGIDDSGEEEESHSTIPNSQPKLAE